MDRFVEGIKLSISRITGDLYIGGTLAITDIPALKKEGITHILNVNWPDKPEPQEIKDAFVHLDLSGLPETLDDGKPKPASWFARGIAFSKTVPSKGKLLVHCGHGINRSPAMMYAIMKSQGYEDPARIIKQYRPQTGTGDTGEWFEVYRKSADEALKKGE
jgi:protein-tyrosine phosphatase